MQVEVQPVGQAEQTQDVDGVLGEHLRALDGQAAALLVEAGGVQGLLARAPGREEAREAMRLLGLFGFQLGAECAG